MRVSYSAEINGLSDRSVADPRLSGYFSGGTYVSRRPPTVQNCSLLRNHCARPISEPKIIVINSDYTTYLTEPGELATFAKSNCRISYVRGPTMRSPMRRLRLARGVDPAMQDGNQAERFRTA